MKRYGISFIGAGRVGEALCTEFFKKGHRILQIASKENENSRSLAAQCGAEWITDLHFDKPADVIFVCVPDNALPDVLGKLECGENTIVTHTAGSFGLEVFPSAILFKGVFYPLQTFSKGRNINFQEIPLFIEASDNTSRGLLKAIAESISSRIYESDVSQRRIIHLAAVFASNFVNYMLLLSKQICTTASFTFDIMTPLIKETVKKAIETDPELSQTGPAIRNDTETIRKHMDLLSFSPEIRNIYEMISKSITEYYRNR
ncbi:MAG TPA: DUF2520 domain-containing protein [Bacteroidales bacterium]|nr:DUF2520 domain-containing protein [Bacteroidales bacterium]